ncbi:Cytoskeleton-associated 2 [Sigmodon hispidus]
MAETRKSFAGGAGRNALRVPRNLPLPPTKRDQPAFREQRKQKLKEYLLIRKTVFPYKQENQISRDKKVMKSEDQIQEEKKILKPKTGMADKENIGNTGDKSCIPLQADDVTSSEIHSLKDNIQAEQLSTRDDFQGQTVTLDQACHLNDNTKDPKRDKAPSRGITCEGVARTNFSKSRLIAKSTNIDQRRNTIAGAAVHRSVRPKEATEERKAPVTERTGQGKGLKRPPNLIPNTSEPKGQNENPVGSFWTTMAEEDEQRLFTEKVNKVISECLNLIDEGCPKEEILDTLNDLVHNIPDAKKLVKYWVCLVRIEPITSPVENIISIYEKAILAGAQPIEEIRHIVIDILTTKSQEKVNLGENNEEACAIKGHTQEVKIEETGVNLEPGDPGEKNKCHRDVKVCENNQDNETKDPAKNFLTPDSKTEAGCQIRYNISSTPCLQSMKKKMQNGQNSTFKELKFLTPVRRSKRIQDKALQLPDMLKDHDPSVSSLEQLSELGGDAFVCRPNAALCPLFSEMDTAGEK